MDGMTLDVLVIKYERLELERKLERARQVHAAQARPGPKRGPRRWLAGQLLAFGTRMAPPELAREWAQTALRERQVQPA